MMLLFVRFQTPGNSLDWLPTVYSISAAAMLQGAAPACHIRDLCGCLFQRIFACGSMVLLYLFVFRFYRSQSDKNEKQKMIKYRSAEGYDGARYATASVLSYTSDQSGHTC
jgi:hypothetical protein